MYMKLYAAVRTSDCQSRGLGCRQVLFSLVAVHTSLICRVAINRSAGINRKMTLEHDYVDTILAIVKCKAANVTDNFGIMCRLFFFQKWCSEMQNSPRKNGCFVCKYQFNWVMSCLHENTAIGQTSCLCYHR